MDNGYFFLLNLLRVPGTRSECTDKQYDLLYSKHNLNACFCACVCAWGRLPVAVWIELKTNNLHFLLSLFLTFLYTKTSMNLIAHIHLKVHLCFHQFRIDYLDCFFHLINVFSFVRHVFIIHLYRLDFSTKYVRKVIHSIPFHSVHPLEKRTFWSIFQILFLDTLHKHQFPSYRIIFVLN